MHNKFKTLKKGITNASFGNTLFSDILYLKEKTALDIERTSITIS